MQYSNKSIWNNARKRSTWKSIVLRQLWNRIGNLEDSMQYNNEDLEQRIAELERNDYSEFSIDLNMIERRLTNLENENDG